jgi:hypothetical protein
VFAGVTIRALQASGSSEHLPGEPQDDLTEPAAGIVRVVVGVRRRDLIDRRAGRGLKHRRELNGMEDVKDVIFQLEVPTAADRDILSNVRSILATKGPRTVM